MSEEGKMQHVFRADFIRVAPLAIENPVRMISIRDKGAWRVLLPIEDDSHYQAIVEAAKESGRDTIAPGSTVEVDFEFTEDLRKAILVQCATRLVRKGEI